MSYATKEQLEEIAAYMASRINIPTIGIGGGYAPIGTIISYMGTTAPQDYLICDGSVKNIADYKQLADFFEAQFGSKNYFGGNGTTTFAVPDLRGEFLRGAGNNSHANQGNGGVVGEHQDGTETPFFGFNQNTGDLWCQTSAGQNLDISLGVIETDTLKSTTNKTGRFWNQTNTFTSDGSSTYTSRPTNTSVLYCIKAVAAGEVYSTEERVVGTWINGKKIYTKVVILPSLPASGQSTTTLHNISNLNDVIRSDLRAKIPPNIHISLAFTAGENTACLRYSITDTVVSISSPTGGPDMSGWSGFAVIEYTKTTD